MNAIYKLLLNKFLHSVAFCVAMLVTSSCVKSLGEQPVLLAGKWAKVDEFQMTSEYLVFASGSAESYVTSKHLLVHDGTIWNCTESDFEKVSSEMYSVNNGIIKIGGEELGEIKMKDDTLTIGEFKKYLRITGFSSKQQSIDINAQVNCDYKSQRLAVSYEVAIPIKDAEVLVSVESDWVRYSSTTEKYIYLDVEENNSGRSRSANTIITYPGASPAAVTLMQSYSSSEISVDPESISCDYAGGTFSFSYSVENPREDLMLFVSTSSDWIRDLKKSDTTISFSVVENNTGSSRKGVIMLQYGDYTQKYSVTQSYSSSKILVDPENISCDYAGGTFGFSYSIENPREGLTLSVSTSSDWIRDLEKSGTTISFSVTENNTGSSRKGVIIFQYGDYTQEYSVIQSYSSSEILVDPESISCDYAGGAFGFSYSIDNPREGELLQVTCPDSWITDISVSSDRVSFRVSENQSFPFRQTRLSLSYANVEKVVSVVQKSRYNFVDLSASGTANCYIVSGIGAYKFPAVKGNSKESVGSVASVDVLWESFGTDVTPQVGDLIPYVEYSDDCVYFSTSENFREGNAVIAAKDTSGKILWSWHIWLTDVPKDQVYNNGAGTMMDRNLGATSATPGEVGALGLLYQWGRKDPFLGSSSISANIPAKSTIEWPSSVKSSSSKGTIDYTVSNPVTFITYNGYNYDWYYSTSTTDNTRWQSDKTIYDPCPPGYRVPSDVWSIAFGTSASYNGNAYDSINEGYNFGSSGECAKKLSGSISTCWYPAAGFMNDIGGSLYSVGSSGNYWSCSLKDRYAYSLYFHSVGTVDPSFSYNRARGYSIRCLKE